MAVTWEISGEVGKALDETKRSFDSIKASGVLLTVGNLEDDKLRFVQVFDDISEVPNYRLDDAQKVEVWRDGVRMFSGVVSKSRVKESVDKPLVITVEVSGPWWWLRNTSLSGMLTDGIGVTKERMKFVFAEGLVDTHIGTVVDRAIALGVPVVKGNIAGMYTVPQISISNQSCANAIAELMRWVPDATAWVDYSGAGNPAIHVSRRGSAVEYNLTAGVDGELQGYDLQPRLDLKVDEVKVNYVQRNAQWKTVFEEQVSGDASAAATPSRQIVTISGPELGDFLPVDNFDSYEMDVKTTANLGDLALNYSNQFTEAIASGLSTQLTFPGGYNVTLYGYRSSINGSFSSPQTYYVPGAKYLNPDGSTYTVGANTRFVAGESPPDWLIALYGLKEVTIKGTWHYLLVYRDINGNSVNPPAWFDYLPAYVQRFSGYTGSQEKAAWLITGDYAVKTYATEQAVSSGTAYRPADYGFIFPPADLAANLLAAQNWLPYEGEVELKHAEAMGQTHLGKVLNIAGSLPEYASMKAPIQRVNYSIDSGDTSITVGAPARMTLAGLVQRFRRNPQDNIVPLS